MAILIIHILDVTNIDQSGFINSRLSTPNPRGGKIYGIMPLKGGKRGKRKGKKKKKKKERGEVPDSKIFFLDFDDVRKCRGLSTPHKNIK